MPAGPIDKLKKLLGIKSKPKAKTVPKRKIPRGLSIKSPGGQTYKRIAERELEKQSKAAQEKLKRGRKK
jgi:hypothetical protein